MAGKSGVLILVVSCCCLALTHGSFKCPSGWVVWRSVCFKESSSPTDFYTAKGICTSLSSTLWFISAEEENNAFKETTGGTKKYWIDLRYSEQSYRTYNWLHGDNIFNLNRNFNKLGSTTHYQSINNPCALWRSDEDSWQPTVCSASHHFLCERNARDCDEGYFGATCKDECHCNKGGCRRSTGQCPGGCAVGWTGNSCGKKKRKVEGMYYCLNTPQHGPRMIFRADPHGIAYQQVTALDQEGAPVDTCDGSSFNTTDGDLVTIAISREGDHFIPDCGARKMGGESTFKWTLRFSEFAGTVSVYDAIFDIKCNFSAADTLERSSDVNNGKHAENAETLEETHLSVTMQLSDPNTGVNLLSAKVGQSLQLHLDYLQNDEFGVKRVAPYNCDLVTTDDKIRVPFVGFDGCAMPGAQVMLTNGNGTHWQSDVFEAFAFTGYQHVLFTCNIEICFTKADYLCVNRCANSKKYPAEFLQEKKRRKRSPATTERKRKSVGTRLSLAKD